MQSEFNFDQGQAIVDVVRHAAVHSPYYSTQPWASGLRAGHNIKFGEIPITPKAVVREETARFFSNFVPAEDGPVVDKSTSGSTGEPMRLRKTRRHFDINFVESQRLRSGWGFELHQRAVNIIVGVPNEEHPRGSIKEMLSPNGCRQLNLYDSDTSAAFELLRETSATLVFGTPSTMLGVLERSSETSLPLSLRLISTVSEVMPDELPERVRRIPGCRLRDSYGCVEAGLIAAQCPLCDAYHFADRHMVVELITDAGQPAKPGEMGRVVLTPLFNRATPLVRYETGDYAIPAAQNGCPHSPRAVERIVGRERNLFKLPDGRKIEPALPTVIAARLGIRQFKLVQTTLLDVELRYIPRSGADEVSPADAQDAIDQHMSPGFRVRPVRVSEFPRTRGGKYFMYECLV